MKPNYSIQRSLYGAKTTDYVIIFKPGYWVLEVKGSDQEGLKGVAEPRLLLYIHLVINH